MFKIIIFCLFFLTFGCAQKRTLIKDVTKDQLSIDNAACRLEGQKATQFDLSHNVFIKQSNYNTAFNNCLMSKGYKYQEKLNAKENDIYNKYKRIMLAYRKNIEPISSYIKKVCRLKDDINYIKCIEEKNKESLSIYLFPAIEEDFYIQSKEYHNMLIRGDISRKEFKEEMTKLNELKYKEILEMIKIDIKKTQYTGSNLYSKE